MTLTIAYSGTSSPSVHRIAEELDDVEIYRDSTTPVDVNWGRADANATLNRNTGNATNKRVMRELFRKHGVPMPKLYWTSADPDGDFPVSFPAVGRPDKHTRGKGFWLVNNEDEMEDALRGTRRKQAATHFMEYISKERAPREYRVHIFLGKVIRVSEKSFPKDGGHYVTVSAAGQNVNHIRSAARAAIEAVGLDFGAVDILANETEAWVLETNSAPGLGGTMPALYANAFTRWKNGEFS